MKALLRTETGRLRLGPALLLWLTLVLAGVAALGAVVPSTPTGGALALLGASLGAGWLLLAVDGHGPAALGFHARPEAPGECAWGLVLGLVVGLAAVAAIAAAGGLRWALAGSGHGWMAGGLGALAFFAVPAAAEEALFRGYPLRALAEAWGPRAALAVTSVGFGVLHLWNPEAGAMAALNVAGAGLFLGALVLRTGSLWWATGAHLGWNWSLGWLADVPVSGLELVDAPGVEALTRGPAWLSGGAFGPEGSVLTVLVMLVAAGWVWWTPRLERWTTASAPSGRDERRLE
ncbi:MAG TPA: CPBP family intramembrane glutamic endopeptidase [Longimicrobiales bacterium]